MPRKKKTKRNQAKYPALDKTYNLKTRTDLLDYDYINGFNDPETGESIRPLNNKEKEWLNKFTEEYVNTDFKDKKRIHKIKKVDHPKNINLQELTEVLVEYLKYMNDSVNDTDITSISKLNIRRAISRFKNDLKKKIKKEMKTIKDFYKKEAYDSNNARNRDVLTRAKAQGKVISTEELKINYDSLKYGDVEDQLIDRLDSMQEFEDTED